MGILGFIFVLLIVILVALVLYALGVYNKLQTTKTRITASLQEIGNQLKRQSGLIPNLESAVKGYLKHEKEIFTEIARARGAVTRAIQSGSSQKLIDAAEMMEKALRPIRVIFESTPALQAKEVVVRLMDELRDTADKVMYARRTLIDLTADFNRVLVTFPSNLVAKIFNFKKELGLKTPEEGAHREVSRAELKTPKIKL